MAQRFHVRYVRIDNFRVRIKKQGDDEVPLLHMLFYCALCAYFSGSGTIVSK